MSPATVVGHDDQHDERLEVPHWVALATEVLAAEGVRRGELDLSFVDEATMAELNAEHLGGDGATDVLSFPLDAGAVDSAAETAELASDADGSAGANGAAAPELLLGDVVICPAVARRQAPAGAGSTHGGFEHRGSLEDELALLVVHGVLHVLGYDHAEPTEQALMRRREAELLGRFHRR